MLERRKIPPRIQHLVRRRAGQICEYCHTSEQWQYVRFTIDHVIPLSQGGSDDAENLALACFHCNRRKAGRVAAVDPATGETVALFNPRRQSWPEHFAWSADGLRIVGVTPEGRTTAEALAMNRERILSIRAADRVIGRHPPAGDPMLAPEAE